MIIRKAKKEEWQKLVDIYKREGLKEDTVLVAKNSPAHFNEIGTNRVIWFALVDNQVVGSIQLVLVNESAGANGKEVAMLHHLRVSKDKENQGIASRLNNVLEKEAKKGDFKFLVLEIEKTNLRAKHIYKHWGYKYLKEGNDPKEIVMIKKLC